MAHKNTGEAKEDVFHPPKTLKQPVINEAARKSSFFSSSELSFAKTKNMLLFFLRDQDSQAETHDGEGEEVLPQ